MSFVVGQLIPPFSRLGNNINKRYFCNAVVDSVFQIENKMCNNPIGVVCRRVSNSFIFPFSGEAITKVR